MEQRVSIERMEEAINLFGSFDENIRLLEAEFHVTVVNRDGELRISGEPEEVMVRSLHKRTPPAWPEASLSCVPLPPMGPPGQQPQPQPLLFWVLPQPQPLPPQNRHRMMMAMMIQQPQPPKQEF